MSRPHSYPANDADAPLPVPARKCVYSMDDTTTIAATRAQIAIAENVQLNLVRSLTAIKRRLL